MFEPTNSYPTNTATTLNGGPKRYKPKQPPLTIPVGCACFRILCHASRIGGVIGKYGVIIKQLQQETSAKIRVEDPPPGSDDRVITVIANSAVYKTISLVEDTNQVNKNNDVRGEYSEVSAAQEALIRVFERILLVAAEADGGYFAPGGVASCRLLTDKSFIGSVIGKGGKVIQKIRKDTGCKIRILVQDKLPSCALPTDEMVEIEGDVVAIKKALLSVAHCIQTSKLGRTHTDFRPPSTSASSNTQTSRKKEIIFRMLYPSDRVGILIGKSGSVIQSIENESGAHITIHPPVSDCDQRLITITATESPESRNSPAQKAVVLVFNRSVEVGFQKVLDPLVAARLVISQNQMGCLLGKGGSIVADMRKVTGAVIKIVGQHLVPKCARDNDQVVLMTGELVNVQDALYSVTGRLRNNLFSNKMSNGSGNTYATSHYPNQHANLTQSIDNLKISASVDRPLTPGQWQFPMGQEIGTRPISVKGGIELGSGGRSAIVSNMSVEIIVPQNVLGSLYGENGTNLTRLRQISGAKVVVHEPRSGTTDHMVVISGTPNETQSAQSLLQAFILADQS